METIGNILSIDFVSALSWTILHSIWQAAIIAAILHLFIKYTTQLTSKTKTLISFSALVIVFLVSVCTFLSYYDTSDVQNSIQFMDEENVQIVIAQINTSYLENSNVISTYIMQYSQVIVIAWVIGMLLCMFNLALGLYNLEKIKAELSPLSKKWNAHLHSLAQKLNCTKTIILGESKNISSPITFGVLKPVILFPVGLINQLTLQEAEAIIAHELAHIVRNDYLVNIIQTLIECIYYFNPGVWIISSTIRKQREFCCDDMAIAMTGNRVHYLKALVAIEENKQDNSLALAFSQNKKPLLDRVQRILQQPQKNNNMKEKLILSALLLIGLMLFSLDVNSRENKNEEVKSEIESNLILEESISYSENSLPDSIPDGVRKLKYLDGDEKYIDKEDLNEMIGNSDVKIIIKNGDISEMEIDGNQLSEDEISKIQYNLSEEENEDLKRSANILIYTDEAKDEETEFSEQLRNKIDRIKIESINDKEQFKNEIRRSTQNIKKEKDRIREILLSERKSIRETIDNAKEEARMELRRARSYSNFEDLDLDLELEDLGEEIAMSIDEVFEDFDIDDLIDDKTIIIEDLESEMEDLQFALEDIRADLAEEMEDLEGEINELSDYAEEHSISTEEIINRIEQELVADNLIDQNEKYSFLLKKNKFQVNGKSLSTGLRNKYQNILIELTDNDWTSNSKLKFSRNGRSNFSEFILKN